MIYMKEPLLNREMHNKNAISNKRTCETTNRIQMRKNNGVVKEQEHLLHLA